MMEAPIFLHCLFTSKKVLIILLNDDFDWLLIDFSKWNEDNFASWPTGDEGE
jgi:hypothetical protein